MSGQAKRRYRPTRKQGSGAPLNWPRARDFSYTHDRGTLSRFASSFGVKTSSGFMFCASILHLPCTASPKSLNQKTKNLISRSVNGMSCFSPLFTTVCETKCKLGARCEAFSLPRQNSEKRCRATISKNDGETLHPSAVRVRGLACARNSGN